MQQVSLRDYCEDARSFIQSGEPHKVIQITRHILRHYPRHIESYRLLGQALLALEIYHEAATQFRRVLSADPEDVSSRVGLVEIHQAKGDLDKAAWHMQRAVDLLPGDSDLRARLGQLNDARQGHGRPEAAQITRAALGRIYARSGLYDKAVQEFKAVLESNPDRGDVQTALAQVLWQAGDHVRAVEVCQRILIKLPNALKANLMIGALWLENQQPDEAEPYLALARELDPENLVAGSCFGEASPLPYLGVKIEPLGEDEVQRVQFWSPPTSSQEGVPAFEEQESAIGWMSDSHEEESKPMNDEERSDEEFELPDWLKGVGDDLLGESDDQPVASTPPESDSEEDDETPIWLRDLVARADDADTSEESVPAEPGDVPDWLQELRPEVPEGTLSDSDSPDWLESTAADHPPDDFQPEPIPGATEPELPEVEPTAPEAIGEPMPGEAEDQFSWEQILAEEGVDLGAVEEAPPPEADGMTAEEWLRSTADLEESPRAAKEPEPAAEEPLVEEPQAPSMPVAQTEADDTGIPDWLREIRGEETHPEEPDVEPSVEEIEPSLLEPLGDVVEESDVPDWLREIAAGEPAPTEEVRPVTEPSEPAPEVEVEETGLPVWLRDFEEPTTEEEAAEAEPVAPEVGTGEPAATADEGRALWEQILAEEGVDLGSVEEAPPPEADGMTAEEWLRSTADLEEAPGAAKEPELAAEEDLEVPAVPVAETELDWLEDTGEPVEEKPQPEPEAEAEAYQVDTPDWLRELQEPEVEIEEPAEAVAEEPPEVVIEESAETLLDEELIEEAVEAEVDEAGLPDWLREPTAEAGEFVEPKAGPPAEMPEWLAELESEDMILAESDFEEPIELETGEMPEWLGEVMAGEPPLADEWAAEPVEAQEDQIPEWLREFRDQEEEPEPEPSPEVEAFETPAEVGEEAQYAEPSELPDWLLHLREGVSEAEVPSLPEEPAVPEVEVPVEELEPEVIQPEAVGPPPMEDLVAAEEDLVEPAVVEEEAVPAAEAIPTPEEAGEVPWAEIPSVAPEPELEPVEAPVTELLVTRKLEAPRLEDLPGDPAARLALARAAFNTGDWMDALTIYETLVSSSEMLDSVIDNLQVGVRRFPDDPAGYQLLGDACMKDGRLHAALEAYRMALSKI
jgi:tetratricopeptide (TPR) repeat protein